MPACLGARGHPLPVPAFGYLPIAKHRGPSAGTIRRAEPLSADHNCEQAGYQLGTREYGACRVELARQSATNNAAMQAFYYRQAEIAPQNQPQTCIYNGSNIGGITGGTMSCR